MAIITSFLTTFLPLLLLSTPLITAKCHTSGTMGKYAEGFLPAACDALSGNYLAGETKRHCVMYDYNFDGEKGFWDFKITKQGGSSWLNREDCMLRLGNEALGCGNGGVSTVADWVISADPGMYKGMEVNPESCANVKLHEMGSKRGSEYKPRFYL